MTFPPSRFAAMPQGQPAIAHPPAALAPDGHDRRVGLDIAFGAPSLDVRSVTAILGAYCLLSDRLRRDYAPAIFGEAVVFLERFPLDFRKMAVDPGYHPPQAGRSGRGRQAPSPLR